MEKTEIITRAEIEELQKGVLKIKLYYPSLITKELVEQVKKYYQWRFS